MAALIEVQRSLAWLPARRPDHAAVVDIEISSTVVHRDIVVAIAGDATELRVFVEGISTGRVGDQREEVFIAIPLTLLFWAMSDMLTKSSAKQVNSLLLMLLILVG